jgi:hypothetical protein
MIRRAINTNEFKDKPGGPVENRGTQKEKTLIGRTNLKGAIPQTQEHAPGLAHHWQPGPVEFIPKLESLQLLEGKLLSNSFLKEYDIHFILAQIIFQLISATPIAKTSEVPNERSHCKPRLETRAWRAGVFLKLVLGPRT